MSYRFADSLQAGSGFHPDDGQRNCPKHVQFHSKNKFEKLVHLLGFIVRNFEQHFFHDAYLETVVQIYLLCSTECVYQTQ